MVQPATVVTANLAFAEWVTVFASNEKLTTALLGAPRCSTWAA